MCRVALGLAFIHLAFDTKNQQIFPVVSRIMTKQPMIMGHIVRDALAAWLKHEDEKRAKATKVYDEDEIVASKSQKIGRLLSAIFKPQDDLDKAVFSELAVDYLVLTHHPEIGEDAQVSWISLFQNLGLDPATILFEQQEKVLSSLWTAASAPPEVCIASNVWQITC